MRETNGLKIWLNEKVKELNDAMAEYKNGPVHETRKFETGATRDTDTGKYDYDGFLSPLVQSRFGQYMHKHRTQSDGSLRDSDNWQRGIPIEQYRKSLLRHVHDVWSLSRGWLKAAVESNIEDALCAVIFNAQGMLHEIIKKRTAMSHITYRPTLKWYELTTGPEGVFVLTDEALADARARAWRDPRQPGPSGCETGKDPNPTL